MKRFYTLILITMTLLAALGAWAMVDGAASYRNRPIISDYIGLGGQGRT